MSRVGREATYQVVNHDSGIYSLASTDSAMGDMGLEERRCLRALLLLRCDDCVTYHLIRCKEERLLVL